MKSRVYAGNGKVIEAASLDEARAILGTDEIKSARKPTRKEFLLWTWLHCKRKEGLMLKVMTGKEAAPWMDRYREDPNCIYRDLKMFGARTRDFVFLGDRDYDKEEHGEIFYERRKRA